MNENRKKEILGMACLILGGLFILVGLVFFVINNFNNLYGKKVQATILSSVSVTTSDGSPLTLMELMYPVGGKNITTTYNMNGKLEDGQGFIVIYYDARNPKMIIEAGWSFETLFLAILGAFVFMLGLYYKGITDFGIVEMDKPGEDAPERVKKTYETKERVVNGLFPSIGALIFIAFGLVMFFTKHNPWMWAFVGAGGLAFIYFSLDMVPAMIELHRLNVAKKFKGNIVDTSLDAMESKSKKKKDKKSGKD